MHDEDSGEEILCPYCSQAEDCPHRLALIDRTFCDCTSGYCANRYSEFSDLLEAAFCGRLKSGTTREYSWDDSDLDDIWKCAFDQYKGDECVCIDCDVLARLVIDLLDRAGGEEYPGSIEDDGGPGCSSALTLFYAENPVAVTDAAILELKTRLMIGREAVDLPQP
jgi:hypothetical protein